MDLCENTYKRGFNGWYAFWAFVGVILVLITGFVWGDVALRWFERGLGHVPTASELTWFAVIWTIVILILALVLFRSVWVY